MELMEQDGVLQRTLYKNCVCVFDRLRGNFRVHESFGATEVEVCGQYSALMLFPGGENRP